MSNLDKVSVVMPVYNGETSVLESIDSILSQKYSSLELIVIDDCSTDRSLSIIKQRALLDSRMVIISLPDNRGVASARNAGIEASTGRYIAFCDADDIWLSDKLEKQIAAFEATRAAICFGSYALIDEKGAYLGTRKVPEGFISLQEMLFFNRIGNLTSIIDLDLCAKPLQLPIKHEDYAMWLSLMMGGATAYALSDCLGCYRIHSGNITKNKFHSAVWHYKILKDILCLKRISAIYFTIMGRILLFIDRLS